MDVVAVNRYSEAIFQAASAAKEVPKVQKDLAALSSEWKSSGLSGILINPEHSPLKKHAVLDSLGKKLSSKLSTSFLHILLNKSRTELLVAISKKFDELMKESQGIVHCEVTLAAKPDKAFLDKIKELLKRITHSEIEMNVIVNAKIIGGVAVKIKNKVLDATFESQLGNMRTRLMNAKMK